MDSSEGDKQHNIFSNSNEEEQWTISGFIVDKIKEEFVENLPLNSIRDLNGRVVYLFGCLAYTIFLILFVGFFIQGFMDDYFSTYISLDRGAARCSEVPAPVTGEYLASFDGIWEGSDSFQYHDAVFTFSFFDLRVDHTEFHSLLKDGFRDELSVLEEYTRTHSLPENIIAWMNYRVDISVNNKVQSLQSASFPKDVFQRKYKTSKAYNATTTSNCNANVVGMDSSLVEFNIDFPYDNGACLEIVTPLSDSAKLNADAEYLQVAINMNTFSTAMAINLGILSLSRLESLGDKHSVVYDSFEYAAFTYVDSRFKNMENVYCMQNVTENPVAFLHCFFKKGNVILLPTFFHYNESCRGGCTADYMDVCNDVDIVAAVIYVESTNLTKSLSAMMPLIFNSTSEELSSIASGSYYGEQRLFDICPECNVLAVNVWGDDKEISAYSYYLSYGHCNQSITSEGFRSLGANPPTQLIQDYYECADTAREAFFYAIGYAFGNMSTFGPLIVLALIPLLIKVLRKVGAEVPKQRFTDDDCDDAAREFMRILLSLNEDGATDYIAPDGVLMQLVREVKDMNDGQMEVERLEAEAVAAAMAAAAAAPIATQRRIPSKQKSSYAPIRSIPSRKFSNRRNNDDRGGGGGAAAGGAGNTGPKTPLGDRQRKFDSQFGQPLNDPALQLAHPALHRGGSEQDDRPAVGSEMGDLETFKEEAHDDSNMERDPPSPPTAAAAAAADPQQAAEQEFSYTSMFTFGLL